MKQLAILFGLVCCQLGPAQVTLEVLAATGQIAPGTGGARIVALDDVVASPSGVPYFQANLDSDPNRDTVLYGPDGTGMFTLLAREGDPAPDVNDAARFGDLVSAFGFLGEGVALTAALDSSFGSDRDQACWVPRGPGFRQLARKGLPAPGAGGADFSSIPTILARSGHAVILGSLQVEAGGADASNRTGLWGAEPNQPLDLIMRQGALVPGGNGARFGLIIFVPILGSDGAFAYCNRLDTSSGTATVNDNEALFGIDANGAVSLWLREGQAAPRGGFLDSFGAGARTAAGTLLSIGSRSTPQQSTSGLKGLLCRRAPNGQLQVLIEGGTPAPGTNLDFDRLSPGGGVMNASGQTAILGDLDTFPDREIIYFGDVDGDLTPIIRSGDPAPGTNARFDLDVFGFPDASPTLNNAGEFIFYGELVVEPGGATEANRRGIWMWQNNALHLLIRSGDTIDVTLDPNNTVTRTISDVDFFNFSGGDDSWPRCLADDGSVTIQADFVEGGSAALRLRLQSPCPGDVQGDKRVDLSDLAVLLANFGAGVDPKEPIPGPEDGDLNGDELVDLTDLAILLANFGLQCTA